MTLSAPAMRTSKRTLTAALEAGDLQAAVAAFRQYLLRLGEQGFRVGPTDAPTLLLLHGFPTAGHFSSGTTT
jgi:hypothetical protein